MPNFKKRSTGGNMQAILEAIAEIGKTHAVTPKEIAKHLGEVDYEPIKKRLQKYRRTQMSFNKYEGHHSVILSETDKEKKVLYCQKGGGGDEAQFQIETVRKSAKDNKGNA